MANKAELNGYTEVPFYKTSKDCEEARFIAWPGGADRQAQLFWSLAEAIGERINYLF